MAAPEGQLEDDLKTYEGFLGFMKYGSIIAFGLGALVVLIIAT